MQQPSSDTVRDLLAEQGSLRSLARALLRDVEVADEVVQEAVLAALSAPPSRERELRPWLHRTVRNLAWKRVERDGRRAWRERVRARESEEASVASPDERASRLELHGLVVEALRGMSEPYRSTLHMRFFEDRSPAEIARLQGIPAGTVRWRLKAGLDQLRDDLDRRHHGGRLAWVSGLVPLARPGHELGGTSLFSLVLEGVRNMPVLAQIALVGAPLVALGPVLLTGPAPTPAPSPSPSTPAPVPAVAAQSGGEVEATPTGTSDAPGRRPATGEGPVSSELLEYARREIRAGWEQELGSEPSAEQVEALLPEFIELVEQGPRSMGRRGALEHAEILAAAEVGGPLFEALTKMDLGHPTDLADVVRDGRAYAKLFEVSTPGPAISAPGRTNLSDVLVEGATLTLPPGVFRIDRLIQGLHEMPPGVTFKGAGMNATLVLIGEFQVRGPVVRLGFEDLTLHTNDNYLFDLRREPASVRMDRVRVIGFDMAAGSSCAFGTEELALLARDSVFAGGYGRRPGSGKLFDVRTDALLARFERCTFDLLPLPFAAGVQDGARIELVDCRLERQLARGGREALDALLEQRPGFRLVNSSVEFFEPAEGQSGYPSADLDLLFPDWQSRLPR